MVDHPRGCQAERASVAYGVFGRAVGACAAGAVLFGVVLDHGRGAPLRLDGAGALALLSLVSTGAALAAEGDARRLRARLLLLGGALASGVFALDLRPWLGVLWASFVALVVTGAVRRREAALLAAGALALPLLFLLAAAASGNAGSFARDLARAVPARAPLAAALLALETSAVVVAAGLARPRWLPAALIATAAVALAVRVAHVALLATMPCEVYWPEAPLLVNALKLDAHQPLYGPPELLDSYTYSPGIDLLHHALLRPLGAELALPAHRVVALLEEAAGIAVLTASVRTHAPGVAVAIVLALAALANPLAPAAHADHALLLLFAVAASLLVAEERWRRGAWWAALVLVTPLAFAFKLSGAGLGAGLFAAFLLERRFRPALAVAASGAVALATIPLFDATLGRFSFYAIRVQASHPMEWGRAIALPLTAAGVLAVAAAAALLLARRERTAAPPAARRLAVLTLAAFAASLPAFAKYAGRENNLALLVVGATAVLVVALRGRAAAVLAALTLVVLVQPRLPDAPLAERADAVADEARVVDTLTSDRAAGRTTLLLVHAEAWIDAGHRDVPHDRAHSAIELFYGGHPEADLLFQRIAGGRYDTVVATTTELAPQPGPLGRFDDRLRESLHDYAIVWPDRGSLDTEGVVILRRTAYAKRKDE
jgi:hypothetical protein